MKFTQAEQVLGDELRVAATITTSLGVIQIQLFAGESPKTANNFAFLAGQKFYENTIIHRVVPGFVVQMGDPEGTGRGGPGYKFPDELTAARNMGYGRGIVAMANSGPNTNGSQFFICLDDVGLPPAYAVFGQVTDGMDVVDAIAAVKRRGEKPVTPVTVESVTVAT